MKGIKLFLFVVMGLVLGIFISWFLCLNCKPVQTTNNNSTKIVLPDSACVSTVLDSLSFVVDRMDGLEKEVNDIRCNYQMEVDLAIDKANGWLAFWIGVLALVIGLMSIWQMYRQNKSEEKFQVLEKNLNSKANVAYKDIRKKADGEIKRIEDELAGVGNGIDAVRHKLKESQMGSFRRRKHLQDLPCSKDAGSSEQGPCRYRYHRRRGIRPRGRREGL